MNNSDDDNVREEDDDNNFRDMILLSDSDYYEGSSGNDEGFIAGEDEFDPFSSLTSVPPPQPLSNNGSRSVTRQMTALTLQDDDRASSNSSFSDYEITASDLEEGTRDWQGIPWNSSTHTRTQFREVRAQEYRVQHYPSPDSGKFRTYQPWKYFQFEGMDRFESVSVHHHQLRHLLISDGLAGVYYPRGNRIKHWRGTLGGPATVRINLCNLSNPFSKITSLVYLPKYDLMAVGGMMGELVLHRRQSIWDKPEDDLMKNWYALAPRETGIITNLEFDPFQERMLLVSCNDSSLRIFDLTQGQTIRRVDTEAACNRTTKNPLTNTVAIATDDPRITLWDPRDNEKSFLSGHTRENFALCWLGEHYLGSGGDDHLFFVHDIRNPKTSLLYTETSQMSCIRSIATSHDNQFVAIMEADDYLHILETDAILRQGVIKKCQTIDFFGEASGVAFGEFERGELLHLGISGNEFSGIMRLERRVISNPC